MKGIRYALPVVLFLAGPAALSARAEVSMVRVCQEGQSQGLPISLELRRFSGAYPHQVFFILKAQEIPRGVYQAEGTCDDSTLVSSPQSVSPYAIIGSGRCSVMLGGGSFRILPGGAGSAKIEWTSSVRLWNEAAFRADSLLEPTETNGARELAPNPSESLVTSRALCH